MKGNKKGMERNERKVEKNKKKVERNKKKVNIASKSEKKTEIVRKSREREGTAFVGKNKVVFRGIVSLRGYSLRGVLYAVGLPLEVSNRLGISGGEVVDVTIGITGRNIVAERMRKRQEKLERMRLRKRIEKGVRK
jgi:hypothetical protein